VGAFLSSILSTEASAKAEVPQSGTTEDAHRVIDARAGTAQNSPMSSGFRLHSISALLIFWMASAVNAGAQLDHFAWSPVSSPQAAGAPFAVAISAQDVSNQTLTDFTNAVMLSAFVSGPSITIGGNTQSGGVLLVSQVPVSRCQYIYLASELDGPAKITALAIKVDGLPGQTLNNWTIRMKPTTLSSYVSNIWEATGWTTVYQSNTTIAVMGWVTFQFTNAFFYDGTNNLMIDFSFRNTTGSSGGSSRVTSTSGNRLLFLYGDTSIGDPLTWSGSTPTAYTYPQVSDIQLTVEHPVSETPTNSDNFVNGVWNGNITILQLATNVILRADDGNHHIGLSDPFLIVNQPFIVNQPMDAPAMLVGSNANFTVIAGGTPPLSYQWMKDSTSLTDGGNVAGATTASLVLTNVQVNDGGDYSVVVTNSFGLVTSSSANLSVYASAEATLLDGFVSDDNQFEFWISGVPGFNYSVQASTNLVNWESLTTNAAPFVFDDADYPVFPQRFYRAVFLP
jgi:hypothetical protein